MNFENFDFSKMQATLAQAKQKYDAIRVKMAATTVEATAGAGMVWVKMNGEKRLLEVRLDPEVVKSDPDMLPDLIVAAVNEAGRRAEEQMSAELGSLASGLPGMF
ncbi:MAG TPA: YbaB/EbfC family nucleoid-associated protein [Terriglobales bacterium]|nr:YbaB/EbfC family nucleoid-associated protein [Terriglobales bacterium]